MYNLIVHGGIGEDGTLQSLLEAEGVPHTGNVMLMFDNVVYKASDVHDCYNK